MIETVVDDLGTIDKKQSHFIERDGHRLLHKAWKAGVLQSRRYLRATALPVGEYVAKGSRVIHRYDPARLISELRLHEHARRARSKEFASLVRTIAKAVGGRVVTLGHFENWVDYRIDAPSKKRLVVDTLRGFERDGAYVIPLYVRRVGMRTLVVVCADSFVDALARLHGLDMRPLFDLIDRTCTITGLEDVSRVGVELQLARAPKDPAPIIEAVIAAEADGDDGSEEDYKKQLAMKRLPLWWDF